MTPPILLIVDVSNIVNRSWHSVSSPDEKTRFNFARARLKKMIDVLLRDCDPVAMLAALDDRSCFRYSLWPEYKGHRKEKDAGLRDLLLQAPEIMRNLGFELALADNHEADDTMSTLAEQRLLLGYRTLICSGDMDMTQVVYSRADLSGTYLIQPGGDTGYKVIDNAAVEAKFGVPPQRVGLWKALAGDGGDGYPGVPGLGPAAAKRLAGKFPSMKRIYDTLEANPELFGKSERAKLEAAGRDHAMNMEKVARLVTRAPVKVW